MCFQLGQTLGSVFQVGRRRAEVEGDSCFGAYCGIQTANDNQRPREGAVEVMENALILRATERMSRHTGRWRSGVRRQA